MLTSTKTLRLRPELRVAIDRLARRRRRPFSEVAQVLLEEGIRTDACPGIYFADEPAGREAKVAGTALGVWEIIRDYKAVGRNERKLARALPGIPPAGIKAALIYYATYPREVGDAITENEAAYQAGRALQEKAARRP